MRSILKVVTTAALAIALAAPAVAPAAQPSKAKAWGKRCKGESKVKDPTTKRSLFKDCVKAKGVGFVVDENGNLIKPPPPPPEEPVGGETGGDGSTP
jgi:hypothetical protein